MLIPKRVKYRRQQRGRMTGKATRGNKVTYGEFGLQALEPDIEKLVLLLRRNRRLDCLKFVLNDFVRMWCEANHIVVAKLVCAVASPDLPARAEELIASRTGCRVILDCSVDAELLGGFVLELENETLDASSFYKPTAQPGSRSRMNVTFTTPNPDLDAKFVSDPLL